MSRGAMRFAGVSAVRRGRRLCALTLTLAFGCALAVCAAALALPEGRHYEMVSPAYKGGYGVLRLDAVDMQGEGEGEGVVFDSYGQFAGQPVGALTGSYMAVRGAIGWTTHPLLAPPSIAVNPLLNDVSPSLQGLYYGNAGANSEAAEEDSETNFFFHDLWAADAASNFLTPLGEPAFGVPLTRLDGKPNGTFFGEAAADPRFCDVVFRSASTVFSPEGGLAFLPEAEGAYEQLYDLATGGPGCGGEPQLRLVAVGNTLGRHGEPAVIEPHCALDLVENRLNMVAAGGSEVFFTPCPSPAFSTQLYVRLAGLRTVMVSTPIAADCVSGPCLSPGAGGAQFLGANEAGTRVFFWTSRPLVSGDTDGARDLYMAQMGCPAVQPGCEAADREVLSLTQVSHDPTAGEPAEVQGQVALAVNGERVYFVARGVLSGANGEGKAPVRGADNLYVYELAEGVDPGQGATHFVAELCSGPGRSGEASDASCPGSLDENRRNDAIVWGKGVSVTEAQTTGDGRFLVFSSYGRLVAGDTDAGRDVYRYDAQTQRLMRVSLGEEGYDANGNREGFDAGIPHSDPGLVVQTRALNHRAISEDGSRIVFETVEPLSASASNGLLNAYEWHVEPGWSEGRVALVSSGSDEAPVGTELGGSGLLGEVAITPSGRDILFLTPQGLLPQDTDGAEDVYDARLGPGFPSQAAPRKACEGDACQGPLTNPAPLLVPGSVVQAAGENLVPEQTPSVRSAGKPRKKTSRGRKHRGKRARSKGRRASLGSASPHNRRSAIHRGVGR